MKNERISMNLGHLELGQIDYLAEKGLYSNRSDFIRRAVRRQLEEHQQEISQFLEPHLPDTAQLRAVGGLGVIRISQADVINLLTTQTKAHIRVVGALVIAKTITPAQIKEIISSIKVYGKIFAEDSVKTALNEMEGGTIARRTFRLIPRRKRRVK